MKIRFTLNDIERVINVDPLARLLDVLREEFRLTGTKEGCGEGECGACTVLLDDVAVNSCLLPSCQVEGCTVKTIEGSGLESIQQAFLDEGGAQCGICTPGMIMMTRAWIEDCKREGRVPSLDCAREALAGNLCRCTGYGSILESALKAARMSE